MNTTLDDIAAEIGLTPTLRLAARHRNRAANCYIPTEAEEGQVLVNIIGLAAAKKLSAKWPGQFIAIPGLHDYEMWCRKYDVKTLVELGASSRKIAGILRISERRVVQIKRELEKLGEIPSGKTGGSPGVGDAAPDVNDAHAGSEAPVTLDPRAAPAQRRRERSPG